MWAGKVGKEVLGRKGFYDRTTFVSRMGCHKNMRRRSATVPRFARLK